MAVIYVSHAPTDHRLATALAERIREARLGTPFLPKPGPWTDERQLRLRESAVVLCLVSPTWLRTAELVAEWRAATVIRRRILPLFLVGPESRLSPESEGYLAELQQCEAGLEMDLVEAGDERSIDSDLLQELASFLEVPPSADDDYLTPEEFELSPGVTANPFPGMKSFDDTPAHAGVFFGRDEQIKGALGELEGLRDPSKEGSIFVIHGASGTGKSSLLKAGILTRLRRREARWLPLRAMKPGKDPVWEFLESWRRTFQEYRVSFDTMVHRSELMKRWDGAQTDERGRPTRNALGILGEVVDSWAKRLREAAGAPSDTAVVVPVDQAEDLASSVDGARVVVGYLNAIAESSGAWQIVLTMRSDSLDRLDAPDMLPERSTKLFHLRPLPLEKRDDVIECPAKRCGVEIAEDLREELWKDARDVYSLPLLAFAIHTLWTRRGSGGGRLEKKDFDGDIRPRALLAEEATRALNDVEDAEAREELAINVFARKLVETRAGAYVAKQRDWTDFTRQEQKLLEHFIERRLVAKLMVFGVRETSDEVKGAKVEVAHSALFEVWESLKGWLDTEKQNLQFIEDLRDQAKKWDREDRSAKFLSHTGRYGRRARRLEKEGRIAGADGVHEYLAAARSHGRRQRLGRVGAVAAVAALLLVLWPNHRPRTLLNENVVTPVLRSGLTPLVSTDVRHGHEFRECESCPGMVVIKGGSFLMGHTDPQKHRAFEPAHLVSVPGPFAVSKTEVTFDQWELCVTYGTCSSRCGISDSGFGRGRRPVINVTWNEARQYARWLQQLTGADYRLLTEAEWEYVARAGRDSSADYTWGDGYSAERGNFSSFERSEDEMKTIEVGMYAKNNFLLHDIHGNVAEWVQDCWHRGYDERAPSDGSAWLDCDNDKRVLRGGGWATLPKDMTVYARARMRESSRSDMVGFRVARSINAPPASPSVSALGAASASTN